MTEKLKPTPGPWVFDESYAWTERAIDSKRILNTHYRVIGPNGDGWTPIAVCSSNAKATDNEANARFIAEAGTVHHECGLSPRELLERCKELRESLQGWMKPTAAQDRH